MKKQLILSAAISAAISAIISNMAWASSDEFSLGKITVSGDEVTQKAEATTIDAQEMQNQGLVDVGQALQRVPGVVLDMGGRRAETKAQIRGFGSTRVTLNLDGIPVYMPYDGNIDLTRYLTGDLSKIEIQKGLGSLMLGPNNMGGSINLITRKPTKEMEGRITAGIEAGNNGIFSNFQSLSVGSNMDNKFYIQAGMSQVDTSNYPLSDDYKPKADTTPGANGDRVHPAGDRIHSGNENTNQSFKFGYTPNSTDEYVVGYQSIKGSKEAPWHAHPEEANNTYWDWPIWDKQSLYVLSHTQLNDSTYLKTRFYQDTFQNRLNGYDDSTYKTVSRTQGRFTRSVYDDETVGAHVELSSKLDAHQVKGIFQAKLDEHTEQDLGKDGQPAKPWEIYQTEIFSLGAEDRWQLTDVTALTFGYRLDQHQVTKVVDESNSPTSDKNRKNNFQVKAEHKLGDHTLFGGVSVKSRFPSPKDVVSRRFDSYEPNHNLNAEKATHFELGSIGHLGKVDYQANLFYSKIADAIEGVRLKTGESCSGTAGANLSCSQNQNVGEATHYGLELAANISLTENARLDASYSYLKKKLEDSSLKATGTPNHQALITMNYFPTDSLDLAADLQLASDREVATDGSEQITGYGLVHLRATYQINKNLRTNLALKNAMDKNYELSKGDPRPGRTLWASLTADF